MQTSVFDKSDFSLCSQLPSTNFQYGGNNLDNQACFRIYITEHLFSILGDNCINKLREDNFSPGPVPFSCHLTLTDTGSEILITDLFSVASVFDSKTGKY